ncbi:hypothetical protein ABEB36_013241 [Hypothenemus hampei]|uniref:G-protein coupled receptors family 3 profile domain-containing protein n=1 Tax=Hypothenemus hampei TaxID=57062 RepID=A0ABD1EBS3_HYPHA
MTRSLIVFFFISLVSSSARSSGHHRSACEPFTLTKNIAPIGFEHNMTVLAANIAKIISPGMNISLTFRKVLSTHPSVFGVILSTSEERRMLALNEIDSMGKVKLFSNRTEETRAFWKALDDNGAGWGKPFKDCQLFPESWFYVYIQETVGSWKIGLFVRVNLDRCDVGLGEIFKEGNKCDRKSQMCVDGERAQIDVTNDYRCVCRPGYFYPGADMDWPGISGEDLESHRINFTKCVPCPEICPNNCAKNGICLVRENAILQVCIIVIQVLCMGVALCLALVVFKQRKTKAIASGMWTILEIILLGISVLYSTVIIRSLKPSILRCLLEPWIREIGFIICYGAIILKLYRHLIEFRTRKAHRWVVKDTDLLKYLLIMILSGLAYMAAFTALTLNFITENYSILRFSYTSSQQQFRTCKYLWWDYVTETGEMIILIFGIHLAYASRNARTQFHERSFLCAAVSLELAISVIFYAARISILDTLHPDLMLIIYCVRSQMSQTVSLLLIFLPKFYYQHKQVRSLGQEYSCRLPLDAFKDPPSQRSLSANNSDVEIGEISIADMNPDDIRAELKRLYLQLEMFKAKTICRDNPHISKRRGGRKAQHRKFSLQKKGSKEKVRRSMSLHSKHKEKDRKRDIDAEITEAEPSRTPEESVCSNEGASAIYADLPTTNQIN